MPTLDVSGPLGTATFAIAWPCAGIESLLIFTAVALLFLKRMNISWKAKIGFFAIGAGVTYFINVLRIATIFTIGVQYGAYSEQVNQFHYYYGPLYAMAWIVSYPLLIIAMHVCLAKNQETSISTAKPCLTKICAFKAGSDATSSAAKGPYDFMSAPIIAGIFFVNRNVNRLCVTWTWGLISVFDTWTCLSWVD